MQLNKALQKTVFTLRLTACQLDDNIKVLIHRDQLFQTFHIQLFQTKEEIFLGLLTREYMKWNEALKNIIGRNSDMDKDSLAQEIAKSMEERKTLLKISAMDLYEIE